MITALPRVAIATPDYDGAMALFRDVLAMPVDDFSPTTVPSLGARVGMCQPAGGSNIELMAPATPGEPLSEALQRFLDRRDEGFYALMLEADDPNAEADELAARDLDVLALMAGAGGRDIHPRSTHGVLIRVYPTGSVAQPEEPRTGVGGVSGIVRAVVATGDADKAVLAYRDGFGLAADEPVDDSARGVRSVRLRAPVGCDIELVSPIDGAKPLAAAVQGMLEARGEGLYAIVLSATDPAAVAAALTGAGFEPHEFDAGAGSGFEVAAFGARIIVEPGG